MDSLTLMASLPSLLRRPLLLVSLAMPLQVLPAITPDELAPRLARNESILLVDVRPAHAFAEGHIPGAIHVPLSLLPHKRLPAAPLVVLYDDGLGLTDVEPARAALSSRAGLTVEVLEGGYARWLAETRLSTQAPGVSPERLPGITYDQLLAANLRNAVLVDLRVPQEQPEEGRPSARSSGARALSVESDPVSDFAARLGVPVMKARSSGAAAERNATRGLRASSSLASDAPAISGLSAAAEAGQLLVLVADDEAAAAALSRQLRASGHYRFTVLIGGTESIRHEGRTGLGRMDGRAAPSQP